MKVMISQPMLGISDDQVIKTQEKLKEKFAKLHIEVIDSFINDPCPDDCNHPGVFYLGRTLMQKMHTVDAVYFVDGWEKARGCRIERKICEEYGIKILDKTFLDGEQTIKVTEPFVKPIGDWPQILPYRSNDPLPIERTIITCQNGKHFKDKDTIYGSKIM